MRIAQVAPLWEAISPESMGSVERMVSDLTEELVQQNHSVTLFASGDSWSAARLVPVCPRALRHVPSMKRDLPLGLAFLALHYALDASHQFDVLHIHLGLRALPFMRRSPIPTLATVHQEMLYPEVAELYNQFKELHFVAVSPAQIRDLPMLNWQAMIPYSHDQQDQAPSVKPSAVKKTTQDYVRIYERLVQMRHDQAVCAEVTRDVKA